MCRQTHFLEKLFDLPRTYVTLRHGVSTPQSTMHNWTSRGFLHSSDGPNSKRTFTKETSLKESSFRSYWRPWSKLNCNDTSRQKKLIEASCTWSSHPLESRLNGRAHSCKRFEIEFVPCSGRNPHHISFAGAASNSGTVLVLFKQCGWLYLCNTRQNQTVWKRLLRGPSIMNKDFNAVLTNKA